MQCAEALTATARTAFSSEPMATESVVSLESVDSMADRRACVGRALDRRGQDVDEDHRLPARLDTPPLRRCIRAVDGDRAVATTSDGAEFYTTDGGRSWTRVQENSAAPF